MISSRTSLRRVALSVVAVAIAGAVPSVAGASSGLPTVAALIASTKADMAKQSSVHVVVVSSSTTSKSSVAVDIGTTNGIETITSGAQTVTISLTPSYAYVRGNALGLMKMMGLTATQQKRVGTKSISMKAGTTPYKNFKANLTFPILSAVLPSLTGTTISYGTGANAKNYVLSWSSKAVGTSPASKSSLTISGGSTNLPLSEYVSNAAGSGTTTFSHWGERINVPTPGSTISYLQALAK